MKKAWEMPELESLEIAQTAGHGNGNGHGNGHGYDLGPGMGPGNGNGYGHNQGGFYEPGIDMGESFSD